MQIPEPTLDHHIQVLCIGRRWGWAWGALGCARQSGEAGESSSREVRFLWSSRVALACVVSWPPRLLWWGAHEERICCLLYAQHMGSRSGPVGWSSRPHHRVGETRRRRMFRGDCVFRGDLDVPEVLGELMDVYWAIWSPGMSAWDKALEGNWF